MAENLLHPSDEELKQIGDLLQQGNYAGARLIITQAMQTVKTDAAQSTIDTLVNGIPSNRCLSLSPEQETRLATYHEAHLQHALDVQKQFEKYKQIPREKITTFLHDPAKMLTKIDAQNDIVLIFPQCGEKGAKLKVPSLARFTDSQKRLWTDKELLSASSSSGSQECLYKSVLRDDAFIALLDEAKRYGYAWNAQKEDEIMHYLTSEMGLSYNPTALGGYQPMMIVRMAIGKKLGWDFLNRDKDGTNGDHHGKIGGKYIDNIQIAHMHDFYQKLYWNDYDYYDASFSLTGDNDYPRG